MSLHIIDIAELETLFKFKAAVTIVDVRKKPAVESEPAMIRGAMWCAHDAVDTWANELTDDVPIVCYCVRSRGQPKCRGRAACQGT